MREGNQVDDRLLYEFDEEWTMLIQEAIDIGVGVDEVRKFLLENKRG